MVSVTQLIDSMTLCQFGSLATQIMKSDYCTAYLDSKSGIVNLVVEYMDGGSLQDLVDRGGCQDEIALADLSHQVI